jgi:hypothetical protein
VREERKRRGFLGLFLFGLRWRAIAGRGGLTGLLVGVGKPQHFCEW